MNTMKDPKKVVMLVFVLILLAAVGGMTYMMVNGDDPLSMFNLRASNPEDELDPFLADLRTAPATPTPEEEAITPTVAVQDETVVETADQGAEDQSLLAYNSTSPTPTPIVSGPVSPTVSLTTTLTPTPTEFIKITGENMTPTVITELPQSGIAGNILTYLVGGGALILVAFLL